MKSINLMQVIGMVWFVTSIALEIGTTIFFMLWLRWRGITLIFGLTGVPGYLEMRYMELCQREARSAMKILVLRLILLINVLLAAIIVIPLIIMA